MTEYKNSKSSVESINSERCSAVATPIFKKNYEEIESGENTPLLGRRPTHQKTGINVGILGLGFLLIGGITIGFYLLFEEYRPRPANYPFNLVYRDNWGALNADRGIRLNKTAFQNVLIFHTRGIGCLIMRDCIKIVREMQNNSMAQNHTDLPYNFLIGGDGYTYEGRGWSFETNLPTIQSTTSLTVAFIGNFTESKPTHHQFEELKSLLSESVRQHKIIRNYKMFGIQNRQIAHSDGYEILNEIFKWKNYVDTLNLGII